MSAEKSFIFDRELWETGVLIDSKTQGGSPASKAYYFSGALDSGMKETVWHKFLIEWEHLENSTVTLRYFASDTPHFLYNDEIVFTDEFIRSDAFNLDEKLAVLESVWVEKVANPRNVLLSKAKGQYLWFLLETVRFGSPVIKRLKVEFPFFSISEYLPAVYRREQEPDSFLNRYLSVFQDFFEDMQEKIDRLPRHLDSGFADKEFLVWLSGWVGISDKDIWDEKTLRLLCKSMFRIYQKKGTAEGLSEILQILTGEPPFILENREIRYSSRAYAESCRRLYGDNLCAFTVFIREECARGAEKYENIRKLVAEFSPAYTEPEVVILTGHYGIGQHVYLGLNSILAKPGTAVLDERFMLNNNMKLSGE